MHSESLVPRLLAERERFVLKRSWDYGGKSVHLGAETEPAAWERVVREAAADRRGGGFVAQERVFAARRPATRITPVRPGAGLALPRRLHLRRPPPGPSLAGAWSAPRRRPS